MPDWHHWTLGNTWQRFGWDTLQCRYLNTPLWTTKKEQAPGLSHCSAQRPLSQQAETQWPSLYLVLHIPCARQDYIHRQEKFPLYIVKSDFTMYTGEKFLQITLSPIVNTPTALYPSILTIQFLRVSICITVFKIPCLLFVLHLLPGWSAHKGLFLPIETSSIYTSLLLQRKASPLTAWGGHHNY